MSFKITIDVDLVQGLAKDLENTTANISAGVAEGVNITALAVRTESVSKVTQQVNLKQNYVDPKIKIDKTASATDPTAVIGAPIRGALLTNFDAQQLTVSNVWTAAMYAEVFGSLKQEIRPNPKAPKMPWTPRKGDPLRKIAAGRKQAGISAAIKVVSGSKELAHVFLIPGSRPGQDGSKFVSMSRPKGGGKAKAKYGPSIDQVVKGVWRDSETDIADTLGSNVLSSVAVLITKGIIK